MVAPVVVTLRVVLYVVERDRQGQGGRGVIGYEADTMAQDGIEVFLLCGRGASSCLWVLGRLAGLGRAQDGLQPGAAPPSALRAAPGCTSASPLALLVEVWWSVPSPLWGASVIFVAHRRISLAGGWCLAALRMVSVTFCGPRGVGPAGVLERSRSPAAGWRVIGVWWMGLADVYLPVVEVSVGMSTSPMLYQRSYFSCTLTVPWGVWMRLCLLCSGSCEPRTSTDWAAFRTAGRRNWLLTLKSRPTGRVSSTSSGSARWGQVGPGAALSFRVGCGHGVSPPL